VVVNSDRDPAAEMADDQVEVFIRPAQGLGRQPGRIFMIEGVEDAPALDFGKSGQAGPAGELVDNDRIDDISGKAQRPGDLIG